MSDFEKPLFNRYDPYVIKGKLDEYVISYMTSKGFEQSHRFSNQKLVLGALATLFTLVAHAYPYLFHSHFPNDFSVLLPCCIGYFFFNLAYQAVDSLICGDIFYTTSPTATKEFSLHSTVKKADDKYNLTVYPSGLASSFEIARFFTAEGRLIQTELRDAVDSLLPKLSPL